MKISTVFVFAMLCVCITLMQSYKSHNSLKIVHVLFRHGDRTPIDFKYSTNPYKKEKYVPYGFSQLTNKGKQRAYNLGKWLRTQYDKFLSRTWSAREMSAYSTNVSRTKASLSLVLAGLYPPKGTALEWDLSLNWNPINYEILSANNPLLLVPSQECKELYDLLKIYMNTKEGLKVMEKYDDIKDIMYNYTKLPFNNLYTYVQIYDTISVQMEQGLEPPKWIEPYLPRLETSMEDLIKMFTATRAIRQLTIGYFIEKIINDSLLKIDKSSKLKHKKLMMYSAHDFNVAMFLKVINPSTDHGRPPYSACIMIEVRTVSGVHGFKVFYQPDVTEKRRSITIDKCGKFCPINQFIKVYKDLIPTDHSQC